MALNPIIGRAVPRGAQHTGIPAFGGQVPRADRVAAGTAKPARDHSSKKSYRGTVAGLGRADRSRIRQPLGSSAGAPRGPGLAVFPTRLPSRTKMSTLPRSQQPLLYPGILRRLYNGLKRSG